MAPASRRPWVGISCDQVQLEPHLSQVTGEKYIRAVADGASATPVLLPALGEGKFAQAWLEGLDGLLLTGSYSNVDPRHYDGGPSVPGTPHDPARDAVTLPLVRAAVAAGVPVFAICRGLQEMNVAFGGSLHPRVHEVPGFMDHREHPDQALAAQYGPAHDLAVRPGGLIADALQTAGLASAGLRVNSLHGQGIARLAPGLAIEATAPDGLVEAVRVEGARSFALGVQWHPEWSHEEQPLSRALFAAFGRACAMRRDARAP